MTGGLEESYIAAMRRFASVCVRLWWSHTLREERQWTDGGIIIIIHLAGGWWWQQWRVSPN